MVGKTRGIRIGKMRVTQEGGRGREEAKDGRRER